MILEQKFFVKPALEVAENLLGKYIVRRTQSGEIALPVTDVEAYLGFDDQASHARFGKTERNSVMFLEGGHIYMYLIYGMYWMFNIVVDKADYPAALLIRGAGEVSGPGRLSKFLQLDKSFNLQALGPQTGLWLEDRGLLVNKKSIQRLPREGVNYAGKWAQKKWRLALNIPG